VSPSGGSDVGRTDTDLLGIRSARVLLRARARQGRGRVRASLFPVLQAAVAAALAFAIGQHVLGHQFPFFAPVSAWVALGFSMDRQVRRVAELAIGVAMGVGLGDLVVHVIGSGWWQVAVVLTVSALLARFIDRGPLLATQAGVQAIVIVGLPALGASGGPLGRWTDALVGGLVALAVAALTPTDPRRRPRSQARVAVDELARMLHVLARGLRGGVATRGTSPGSPRPGGAIVTSSPRSGTPRSSWTGRSATHACWRGGRSRRSRTRTATTSG
jgi:hypothetical protein